MADEHEKETTASPAEQAFFAEGDAEVDPELLRLPRRGRRRRHPIISAVVILLSAALMLILWEDFLYFFQPGEPVDLGNVGQALKANRLRHNTHVQVSGTPDRKYPLILEGRISGYDSLFRLMEAPNRFFIQRHRERRYTDQPISSTYSGKLVRFDSLPYADNLREYFAKRMTLAYELDFKRVAQAKAGASNERARLNDLKGQRVTLEPDSQVWINVAYPDEWVVQFSKHVFGGADQAHEELGRKLQGLDIPFVADKEPSRLFWRFVMLADPDQFARLKDRFPAQMVQGRPAHGLVRRQVSYSARWNQLRVKNDTLVIDAADPTFPSRYHRVEGGSETPSRLEAKLEHPVVVPSESILYITTSAPFSVPDEAFILLTDKAPGDSWYYVLLFAVLLAFIGVNAITLVLRLRQRPAPPPGGQLQ